MEGIETVDAILSKVYPKADFEKKDKEREERAKIDIKKLKMDRLEKLLVASAPISLIIDSKKKL
ncbi:hypothetical protein [Fluviicola taffensis]|uniref:hypothetical protein n=1 Tax=Fluviicola taffensis TaxID=191579 RepID=UPI0031382B09